MGLEVNGFFVRRVRKKLGLTQIEMSNLFAGGGHNAVSRYEQDVCKVPRHLAVLLTVLDKHPEYLEDIRKLPGNIRFDGQTSE